MAAVSVNFFLALLSPIIPMSPQSVGVVPIMFPTQDKIGSIKREDGDFKPSYDRLYSLLLVLSLVLKFINTVW
jgi:hypothetical protein